MNKDRRTYEIMSPESVGQASNQLTLGVTSGRSGLRAKAQSLGHELDDAQLTELYLRFMEKAAQGRVSDDTLKQLLKDIT